MVSSFISYSKIRNPNEKDFHEKFGSLFGEFKKNEEFLSSQYYGIFFIRRFAYLFAQVYLNNYPYVQVSVNIGFALLQIAYLVYYRPFKDTHIFISVITGEISGTICIVLSAFFLNDISADTSALVERIFIFTVMSGMGVQFLVSVYSIGLGIKLLWERAIKYRAKELIGFQETISGIR